VAEGTIITLTEASNLVFIDVSQTFALESMGLILFSMEQWGFKIGLVFLVLDSLMYAILFVTNGSEPSQSLQAPQACHSYCGKYS
jgi:hypothetical protein